MTTVQVAPPYPVFADLDGSPLDAGYIYLGMVDQNPETNPISVYWDENLSIPAPQPIRTIGGYPSRNGTPAVLYTDGAYSVTVKDKRQSLVFYAGVGYSVSPNSVAASLPIQIVAANIASINNVLGALPEINTINASIGSVNAVAGDLGGTWGLNVTYDFGSITEAPVGVISPPGGNIVVVADNIADVDAVATDIADVNTVATNIASVNTTATNIASVNTAATNIAAIIAAPTEAANAAASASAAATSESNAAASEASALAILNTFKGEYYGAASADPTVDPLGNPPSTGDLYFNNVANEMRVYNGTLWQPLSASGGTPLLATNNLSDVVSASTSRSNLGLGALAVLNTVGTTQIDNNAVTVGKLATSLDFGSIV